MSESIKDPFERDTKDIIRLSSGILAELENQKILPEPYEDENPFISSSLRIYGSYINSLLDFAEQQVPKDTSFLKNVSGRQSLRSGFLVLGNLASLSYGSYRRFINTKPNRELNIPEFTEAVLGDFSDEVIDFFANKNAAVNAALETSFGVRAGRLMELQDELPIQTSEDDDGKIKFSIDSDRRFSAVRYAAAVEQADFSAPGRCAMLYSLKPVFRKIVNVAAEDPRTQEYLAEL